MSEAPVIRELPGFASDVVLVCRKCSRKVGGGFGRDGSKHLAKVLGRELGARRKLGKKRRVPAVIVETKCLGLCPKGQVVVVRGGEGGHVLLVTPGASPDAVARALGFRQGGSG